MPKNEPRWDWFGAFLESQATGMPVRPPDDTPLRDVSIGVSEAAKRFLKGIGRQLVPFTPYVGDPADLALTWHEGGYGPVNSESLARFAAANKLAFIPILSRTGRLLREAKNYRSVLNMELPGIIRVAKIQHADDPLFAEHATKRMVVTKPVEKESPLNDLVQNERVYGVRVGDVKVENPAVIVPGDASVYVSPPTNYLDAVNPNLARLNRLIFNDRMVITPRELESYTRDLDAIERAITFKQVREMWKQLSPEEKMDLLLAWRDVADAARRSGRDIRPMHTALNDTAVNLLSRLLRRKGFDAVLGVRPGYRQPWEITEIGLIPTGRRLVIREGRYPVDMVVREAVR